MELGINLAFYAARQIPKRLYCVIWRVPRDLKPVIVPVRRKYHICARSKEFTLH